jgi:hypothetical protein
MHASFRCESPSPYWPPTMNPPFKTFGKTWIPLAYAASACASGTLS